MSIGVQGVWSWALIAWLAIPAVSPAAAKEAARTREGKPAAAGLKAPVRISGAKLTNQRIGEIAQATGMTSKTVRLAIEFTRKYRPLLMRELDDLLQSNPKQFRLRLADCYYQAYQLAAIKNPALRAKREQYLMLESQAEQAAIRYREATEAEKPRIEAEIKGMLDKLFDLKIADEQAQLKQTRKNLEEKQADLNQRAGNKDRLVDRELIQILGIEEALAW